MQGHDLGSVVVKEAIKKSKLIPNDIDELKEGWKSYRDGDELEDDEKEMSEGDKEKYTAFFKKSLEKWGVSSPDELDGDKKRDFFNYVDKNWDADIESD